MRLAGASLDTVAARFGVHPDSIWRHVLRHLSDDYRAMLLADEPLAELADLAATENAGILDHLKMIRGTLMRMFVAASTRARPPTSIASRRSRRLDFGNARDSPRPACWLLLEIKPFVRSAVRPSIRQFEHIEITIENVNLGGNV